MIYCYILYIDKQILGCYTNILTWWTGKKYDKIIWWSGYSIKPLSTNCLMIFQISNPPLELR